MGTSLTGTKPKDTYDSLIKVGDNGPISGTAKTLSDGLGNDLPIAVSTSNVGIGTSSPADKLSIKAGNGAQLGLDNAGERFTQISFLNNATQKAAIWLDETLDEFAIYAAAGYTTPIYANGIERVRVTNNGLTFNGDSAAANALDDYEEGTWTMGVSFGGGSAGVTYSTQGGTYTKIGRQVTVNGFIILSSKGSSTGTAAITGLPFTSGNSSGNNSSASLWLFNVSFANQFQGIGDQNATTITLYETTEAGAVTTLEDTNFANDSRLSVTLTYFV